MLGPANLATSGLNNLEMCISARMTNGGGCPAHVAHVAVCGVVMWTRDWQAGIATGPGL